MNDQAPWLTPALLDSITEGVVVMDRDLRYVFVNRAAEGTMQVPAGQLLGQCVWDVFPQPPDSPFRQVLEEALATGHTTVYRGYVPERDRWFEQRCYPYSRGVTILFHDVTEQTRTAEALQQSEGRFRTTADSAPVLIWMSDVHKARIFFNRAWADFTGRPEHEQLGHAWQSGVHPDDLPGLLATFEAAFEDRRPFETEYRLRRHDGAYRWMLVRASPRFDADGAFEGFTGSCTDIHERWSSEHQMTYLAEASRLLSSTLDYETVLERIAGLVVPTLADWAAVDIVTNDTTHATDTTGTTHANDTTHATDKGVETGPGAAAGPGAASPLTIERVATLHVDPDMVAWAKQLAARYPPDLEQPGGLGHVIRTGESVMISEITPEMVEAGAQDAEHLEIIRRLAMTSAIIVPLRTRERVIGALSLVTTHGSRRYEASDLRFAEELAARAGAAADNAALYRQAVEAESALREINEALEARVAARTVDLARSNHTLAVRNRELQDFAYVASHDLQEPLRKIRAFADLLMVDYASQLEAEAAAYLARIQDSAARMSRLIADLLSFSRVTTTGAKPKPVDLNATLAAVLSDLEVRLNETAGTVRVDGRLPMVTADPVQMHQLLLNLVGNGLKFHRPGVPPQVVLHGTEANGDVVLTVEDNGIGFEEKYAERIFAPFQRLHGREDYEGTGMGLAIVRRIVERHQGTITATSRPGQGSRFVVTLSEASAA